MRLLALALVLVAPPLVACVANTEAETETRTEPKVEEPAPPAEEAPKALAYPEAPYGKSANAVFPNVTFEGYREGTGAWTSLSMLDYFDPDDTKGVRALYIVVAAQWCSVCQQEAQRLPKSYPALKDRGARFLMLLGQDNARKPALQSTIDAWQSRFHVPFDIGADPKLEFLPPGATGFPTCYVVDPRTMKIVRVLPGITADGTIPGLETMLKKNGG